MSRYCHVAVMAALIAGATLLTWAAAQPVESSAVDHSLELVATGGYSFGAVRSSVASNVLVLDVLAAAPDFDVLLTVDATPRVVMFGDLVTFTVELTNLAAAFDGALEFVAPAGTRPEGAEEPRTIVRPSAASFGSSTDGGWIVPISVAADTTIQVPFFTRVLPSAGSSLEARFLLRRSVAGEIDAAVEVDVTVIVTVDDGPFRSDVGTVVGSVTDSGGAPVAGARLILPDGRTAYSDADGRFSLGDVERGWWYLQLDPATIPGPLAETVARVAPYATRIYVDGVTRLALVLDEAAGVSTDPSLWIGQASLGARYDDGAWTLEAGAAAYASLHHEGGTLELALSGSGRYDTTGTSLATGWLDLGAERYDGAPRAVPALYSDDGIAFRYEREGASVAYEAAPISFPGIGSVAFGSALRASLPLEDSARLDLAVGLVSTDRWHEAIEPDGTRRYLLGAEPVPGSERVRLLQYRDGVLIGSDELRAGRDYVIEREPSTLVLARPLWATAAGGVTQALDVSFMTRNAVRNAYIAGASWSAEAGPLSAYVSAATVPVDGEQHGAAALGVRYRDAGLDLGASIERRAGEDAARLRVDGAYVAEAWNARVRASLGIDTSGSASAQWRLPWLGIDLRGSHTWREGRDAQTRLSATVPVGEIVAVELRHSLTGEAHASEALLHAALANASLTAGARYEWSVERAYALVAADASFGIIDVRAAHTQALNAGGVSTSALDVSAQIAERTRVSVGADHVWGDATSARAAIEHDLGDSRWVLGITSPAHTDIAPQAHVGVDLPLTLSERLRVDIAAGLEGTLGAPDTLASALSVAARYDDGQLRAGIGADVARRAGETKVIVAADASGRIADAHTLSLDARFELQPERLGRLSVGYAFQGESVVLLVDQRLLFEAERAVLQGNADLSWQLSDAFTVRPRGAYRTVLGDSDSLIVQAGLGGTFYLHERFGVGAVAYAMLHPNSGDAAYAFGLESALRLMPGADLVLGYTFGDGPGLLVGGASGAFVRFDVYGGTR